MYLSYIKQDKMVQEKAGIKMLNSKKGLNAYVFLKNLVPLLWLIADSANLALSIFSQCLWKSLC